LTVTVAPVLVTEPQELVTRTQYEVVADGATVMLGEVAPAIGEVVTPDGPMNHWYVSGPVPVAETESVVEEPAVMVREVGCEVITGAVHGTVHVPPGYTDSAAFLSHGWSV
jgi:hypothetical protein